MYGQLLDLHLTRMDMSALLKKKKERKRLYMYKFHPLNILPSSCDIILLMEIPSLPTNKHSSQHRKIYMPNIKRIKSIQNKVVHLQEKIYRHHARNSSIIIIMYAKFWG